MFTLFAHHDLLQTLDFLGLRPVSALDHVVAFIAYSLLLGAVIGAGLSARRVIQQARRVSRQTDPRTP